MYPMPIELPRRLANQILHCVQNAPATEVHGFISARDGVPHACLTLPAGATGETSLRIRQQVEARDETLFAAFHAHPGQSALPDRADLSREVFPAPWHLLVSLTTQGVLEMRGYTIDETGHPREVELILAGE